MLRVGIIGASGYAGGELARLLQRHPEVSVTYLGSETYAGQPFARAFPAAAGTKLGSLVCEKPDAEAAAAAADVIFLAGESGMAMRVAAGLLKQDKKLIDISADFRIRDVAVYERFYKIPHQGVDLLRDGMVAYGLVELNRDAIRKAKLIANPGCFPTATLLGLAPLVQKGLVATRGIVVDAKSGISGAGRAKSDLALRFSEANETVVPYGVGGVHRHVPEIEQELSACAAPETVAITFTPHRVPMTRGLLATCYAPLAQSGLKTDDVVEVLRDAYVESPFVVIRDAGDQPSTKDVYGSNYCHIAAAVDSRTQTVIVTSVIDNLVKGAAGQAIQNMNLMLNLPETTGLEGGGLWP